VSNSVGDAASLHLLDDGSKATVLINSFSTDNLETEDGCRRWVIGSTDAAAAAATSSSSASPACSRRHILGKNHAPDHFRAVVVRLPRHRVLLTPRTTTTNQIHHLLLKIVL
jgi:hypothetical protein